MAKNYHSRSPEEFREYLEKIKQEKRSPIWRQFIILIDIVILMVVLYLVHQVMNPGSTGLGSRSTVEEFNGHRLTLTASQVFKEDGALLYLIAENKSNSLSDIASTWKIGYKWYTESFKLCSENHLEIFSKIRPIPPLSSGLLELPIPPPNQTQDMVQPEECKMEYFRSRKAFGIGSFKKRVLILQLILTDIDNNKTEMNIPINPYP